MKVLALVTSLVPLTGRASAHERRSHSLATLKDGEVDNSYSAILVPDIDGAFREREWGSSPVDDAAAFAEALPISRFDSLRALIDSVVIDCSSTMGMSQRVHVSSSRSMRWQDDIARADFAASQHGPCEAWIDDRRVFHSADCLAENKNYPVEIPVDASLCHGQCMFTFYWLALQNAEWEAHKHCASIVSQEERIAGRRLGVLTQYFVSGLDSLFGGKRSEENSSSQLVSSVSVGLGALSSLVGLRK